MLRRAKYAIVAAGLLLALASEKISRRALYNVMSNTGRYYNYELSEVIKNPSYFFRRGDYTGMEVNGTDLNAVFLGIQENTLPVSEHRPTRISGIEDKTLYSLSPYLKHPLRLVGPAVLGDSHITDCRLAKLLIMNEGDVVSYNELMGLEKTDDIVPPSFSYADLYHYTLSFGRDERGLYSSAYDMWDFSPNEGIFSQNRGLFRTFSLNLLSWFGQPIHFYDRFYWQDYGFTDQWLQDYLCMLEC